MNPAGFESDLCTRCPHRPCHWRRTCSSPRARQHQRARALFLPALPLHPDLNLFPTVSVLLLHHGAVEEQEPPTGRCQGRPGQRRVGAASSASSMAAAAAAAAALSSLLPPEAAADQSDAPSLATAPAVPLATPTVATLAALYEGPAAAPSAAPSAMPSAAPAVAPAALDDKSRNVIVLTSAPVLSVSPASGPSSVGVPDRERKGDTRASTRNLSAGGTAGSAAGPSSNPATAPAIPAPRRKGPPTAIVDPPAPQMGISSMAVPVPARLNKGKGRAPLVAILPAPARMQVAINRGKADVSAVTVHIPRGPVHTARQLYVAGPNAGTKPFTTLKCRDTPVDWSRARSGGSFWGAGPSRAPLPPVADLDAGHRPVAADVQMATVQMRSMADRVAVEAMAAPAATIMPAEPPMKVRR